MLVVALLAASLGQAPSDLLATGVVLHAGPGRSVAILRASGRTRVVSVGDTAFGGKVLSIEQDAVSLAFESGRVELRLAAAQNSPTVQPPPALPQQAPQAPQDPPLPKTMARKDVEKRLGNEIPRILSDTALAPAMEDGRVMGLTVVRMADGTLLTDAGLRQGDVITEINGTAIDGMATLLSLWPSLQNATELRAVVRRGGKPVALSLTLR